MDTMQKHFSAKLMSRNRSIHSLLYNVALLVILLGATGLVVQPSATAAVTSIGPFVGDHNEGFEGFTPQPVNSSGASNLDSQPIFGGIGTCALVFAADEAGIYQNTGANTFNLGSATAKVRTGTNGFATRSGIPAIVFKRPAFQFGGYFGGHITPGGTSIQATFYDFNGDLIDQVSFNYTDQTGALVWQGWSSPTAIATVNFFAGNGSTIPDEFVMDDLTVNCDLPKLSIRVLTNQTYVTWSTNFTGYQLEQLTQLQAPFTNWSNVATAPTNTGQDWQVVLPVTNNAIFRLRYGL